jgi:uncharacterized protein (DUF697 family)
VAKPPVNFSKILETWRETLAATGLSTGVVLGGDERLVALAKERFSTGGTSPALWARSLTELGGLTSVPGELLVLFLGPDEEPEARMALEKATARGGVILAIDEGESAKGRVSYLSDGYVRLSFSETARGWRRLFETCAEVAGGHVVSLGRRYPAVRRAAARRIVYRTAAQNALIGAAFFVPGTDMPAMTLNQVKMVLSLAGIYGVEIGRERAVELIAVVGLGFGLRALARSFLRSTPGLGWVVKASTGFTGTVAVGMVAIRYFEKGAPASTSRVLAVTRALRS